MRWIRRALGFRGRIGDAWCLLIHDSLRWPIHGHYECGICGRLYEVPWTESERAAAARVGRSASPRFSFPILLGLLIVAVLRHFIIGQSEIDSWPLETIDIQASLPKWKKTGRLRAVRTLPPAGEPDYRVLEAAGDRTVEHQVILRYSTADERATRIPVSSVGVTLANYKLRYIGTVSRGTRVAYVSRIIPRKKREALINGMVWRDSETGSAVRESG